MRKRKKQFFSLLSAVLLCTCLAGCHGSRTSSSFETPKDFDTSREYLVTFWAKNDTNKTQVRIYKSAIEEFQKLYPNITVKLRLYTDYGKIYNDVISNIATGTTPNVCITYPDHIATYLTGNNVVVPLDGLFTDGKYGLGGSEIQFEAPTESEIVPEFLQECRIGDHYYAVPFMRSTEACYVNKTYVERLGYTVPDVLTWDYIWEVADAATEKDSSGIFRVNGQNIMIPFIYKSTDNMMIQMIRQKGSGYSTEGGTVELFNDTTKQLLFNIAEHTSKGAFSTFKISSYPANFLNAGQCIFAIDSTAGATWMGSGAPLLDIAEDKVVNFETAVRMIPQFDPSAPRMISQGPSICVFNKDDPQEVLASWLFTQYLLSNDVQIAYAQTEGYVPVTEKAQNSSEYRDYLDAEGSDGKEHYDVKIKASKLLIDNTENTFVTPVFNGSASLRDASGQLIEEVAKSARRKEKIDDRYMENLFEDVTSLYRLDQIGTGMSGRKDLGPLPETAIALLCGIAAVWVLMGIYVAIVAIRKNKRKQSQNH